MSVEIHEHSSYDGDSSLALRLLRSGIERGRPALGWPVFLLVLALALMPAMTLRATGWLSLGVLQIAVDLAGPLGICMVWLLVGWKRDRYAARAPWSVRILWTVLYLIAGFLLITQLVVGWLPGLGVWQAAVLDRNWLAPFEHAGTEWVRISTRVTLWWQGVMTGGAAQDNLIFALFAGSTFWVAAGLSAAFTRHMRQGLSGALPLIIMVMSQLVYTGPARGALVSALALAIALHLVLDQARLTERWNRLGLDYNPGIWVDRGLVALSALALLMGLAAIFPNVYVMSIAQAYYDRLAPVNERIEGSMERLFPDARGVSRIRGSGLAGGLPNEFLLRGGPDLGRLEVLRYRTDEVWFSDFPMEDIGPPGYYMRGGTFSRYNGRGWSNPSGLERIPTAADEPLVSELPEGRKQLVQSVILAGSTQILYAAPEIVEASVDFRLESRGEDDVVAAWARDLSYSVVSSVPAISEARLRELPEPTADAEMAEQLAIHLELPDSVTERTRQLAQELTADADSAYARAAAIEAYLRTYEYDLEVSSPPGNVADVADYFLFDLQRGYCDYYATAFIVLARLSGLPARFATGFATGYWDPVNTAHIVTEADAHSWPEVYFPEVGWIPFEPTAGRAMIARIGQSSFEWSGSAPPAAPVAPAEEAGAGTLDFSWQTWLWLLPGLGLVWAFVVLLRVRWQRRADPWGELLAWGRRLNRPIQDDETPLEYGRNLATHVMSRVEHNQDAGRLVAREMQGMGIDVSDFWYGPDNRKSSAEASAAARWQRLRGYQRAIRLRSG